MTSRASFAEEAMKDRQEEDLIFKKMNIPWLSNQDSTLPGEVHMDSEVENLMKTMQNHISKICFLNETNDKLVMTNRILREYLEDINSHYQELIEMSKEALKRKREIQNQAKDLTKQIQDLSKQNKVLLSRVKSLEIQQARYKKKSHALEGIVMLVEAAKQL